MGTNDGSRNFSANCDLEGSRRNTDQRTRASALEAAPGRPREGHPGRPRPGGRLAAKGAVSIVSLRVQERPENGRRARAGAGARHEARGRVSTADSGRPAPIDFWGKGRGSRSLGGRLGLVPALTTSFPGQVRFHSPPLAFSAGAVWAGGSAGGVGAGRQPPAARGPIGSAPGAQVGAGAPEELSPRLPAPPSCGPAPRGASVAGQGGRPEEAASRRARGPAQIAEKRRDRGKTPGPCGGGTRASLDACGRGRRGCEWSPAPAP